MEIYGNIMRNPWKIMGNSWEHHGKSMEIYGNIMRKSWILDMRNNISSPRFYRNFVWGTNHFEVMGDVISGFADSKGTKDQRGDLVSVVTLEESNKKNNVQ